ncbi:hypothetical protein [Sphingobium algorifonticola]|uniref:Uncharacterized protein n=1 Tax=Sphingobium algorifonticola TaxID=2008318 RepID=A0A437J3L9_9SPHN|nr:hypothetical protein [Sphingobium algorifonticola]RVT39138.1 hypothetical protein ENE74_16325 [Sphingobium algorifonticola]
MTSVSAHLRFSTLISVVISMAISAAFFLLIFGGTPNIRVFTVDGLALDFIPQTLAAGFMSALVPAIQTRAKMVAGSITGSPPPLWQIAVRALGLALGGLALAGVITALLWLAGAEAMSWASALAMKIGYGGLLGLIITPIALRAILPRG